MFSKNFNQQIIKIEMSASSVYNNDKSTRKAILNSTITKCQHRNPVGQFIAREDVLDSNQMRSSHSPKRNRVYQSARFQVSHPLELTEGMPAWTARRASIIRVPSRIYAHVNSRETSNRGSALDLSRFPPIVSRQCIRICSHRVTFFAESTPQRPSAVRRRSLRFSRCLGVNYAIRQDAATDCRL